MLQEFWDGAQWQEFTGPPASSPLTLIAGVPTDKPLTLKGAASQSANLLEAQNSSGSLLAYIANNGSIFGSDIHGQAGYFAGDLTFPYQGARLQVQPVNASEIGLIVKGYASQSGNLQEWRNSSGTAMTYINANGSLVAKNVGVGNTNVLVAIAGDSLTRAIVAQAAASQSANIQEWQDSSGSAITKIFNEGSVGIGPAITLISNATSQSGNGFAAKFGGMTPGTLVALVRGAASQTANLQEWQNSGGSPLAAVDSIGRMDFALQNTTSARPAGGAAALPATPLAYLEVKVGGSLRYIPYYA